ncbi:MAG TPA: sensor domain-containing diguanylate cyclase [Burkholderiales bacterium]
MPADRKPFSLPAVPRGSRRLRAAMFADAGRGADDEAARLKHQIWQNERIWSGFRRLEVSLIGAHSLRELVSALATEFPRIFPKVDRVTLACFDPEYEITRMLNAPFESDPTVRERVVDESVVGESFIAVTQESLRAVFGGMHRPRLGPSTPEIQALLFPGYPQPLGSVALAPLLLRGQLIGALNQASLDPRHFAPDTATDLLEHLAAVTTMCLDNAVSRERLRWYGLMDPLTGVANRRLFEHRLGDEIERWLRRPEPLAYMLVDVDHFKRVNDKYGHRIGDEVLQQMAEVLGRDLRGADLLARYGGEEFVMLLPNTTRSQATAIAQRICSNVAAHKFKVSKGHTLSVSISIGVACLDGAAHTAKQPPSMWLYEQADESLYAAKHAGRNRISVAAAG